MSLKRALKKNKDQKKEREQKLYDLQAPQQSQAGPMSSFKSHTQQDLYGSPTKSQRSKESDGDSDSSNEKIHVVDHSVPQYNVMEEKIQAVLNQYSSLMRDVIKEKVETITFTRKPKETADNANDESSRKNGEDYISKEQEIAVKMEMQFKKDSLVMDLLEKSNDYMEKNLNAAANNMSLMAMHSFELGYHVERQCKEQVMKEKIVRNIQAHTKFIH